MDQAIAGRENLLVRRDPGLKRRHQHCCLQER